MQPAPLSPPDPNAPTTPTTPTEAEADEQTPPPGGAPSRRALLAGVLERTTLAVAGVGAAAATGHLVLQTWAGPAPTPEEPSPTSSDAEGDARLRPDLATLLVERPLGGPCSTGSALVSLIETSAAVAVAPGGQAFYYTLEGDRHAVRLATAGESPALLRWHNANRRRLAELNSDDRLVLPEREGEPGYPLLATSGIPAPAGVPAGAPVPAGAGAAPTGEAAPEKERPSRLSGLERRLEERLWGAGYFGGATVTLRQAIERIASAHGVPDALVFGLWAEQGGAFLGGEDRHPPLPDALSAMLSGPLLPVRTRPVSPAEVGNRFVQIERLCLRYRALLEGVAAPVEALRQRLPIPEGVALAPLAALSAWRGGLEQVDRCVADLLALPDPILQARLGAPPYGLDLWLAALAGAMGRYEVDVEALIAPARVLAWGWLLSPRDEVVEPSLQERSIPPFTPPPTRRDDVMRAAEGAGLSVAGLLGGLLALSGLSGGLWSRRGLLLQATPAALALGGISTICLPSAHARLQDLYPPASAPPTAAAAVAAVIPARWAAEAALAEQVCAEVAAAAGRCPEGLEPALVAAAQTVGGRIRQLRLRGSDTEMLFERNHRRQYLMDEQTELLAEEAEAWYGEGFVKRFAASRRRRLSAVRKLFEEGAALQTAGLAERLERGEMIAMREADPRLPYFCQQVGQNSGLENHPDALYMHREFLPLLFALRALMNHQIDRFNGRSLEMGYEDFPEIPRVDAIKISGAFRPMMQFYDLNRRYPGRTTRSISAHTIGHALDIGALAPALPGAGVVRFAGPMTDRAGQVHIPPGGYLPTSGYGAQTRGVISRMIGRALMALEEPLLQHRGVILYPLWEQSQLNWHIVIRAPSEMG